jgi:hypothetical protein
MIFLELILFVHSTKLTLEQLETSVRKVKSPKSGLRFQDHIERRFCGTADPCKSTFRENGSQTPLASLRSKGKTDLLAERTGSAYNRREPVINSPNWIDILSERIASEGLHNHELLFPYLFSFLDLRLLKLIG